jgi:rubrerythrin
MPNFFDPFSGKIPDRKLTNEELIRAIRLDIAGENEAVHGYMAHADATSNTFAKKILTDIANEERVHIGELTHLLNILTKGEECSFQKKGAKEVKKSAAPSKNTKKKIKK